MLTHSVTVFCTKEESVGMLRNFPFPNRTLPRLFRERTVVRYQRPSNGIKFIVQRSWQSTAEAQVANNTIDSDPTRIRNFSIIAHIDHGKSTLADRLLECLGSLRKGARNQQSQVLDSLKVERDRGITVKAQTASGWFRRDDQTYLLNLVDTPGHVDFSYEVSRSLAACQGALLLVDATQGIQAQTLANFYLAFSQNLTIIPVINKVDLPHADVPRVKRQIESILEIPADDAIEVSAKSGLNVEAIIPTIIDRIPPPSVCLDGSFRALLFDSWFDEYKGVVFLLSITDGKVKKGDKIRSMHTGKAYDVVEVGILRPVREPTGILHAGQVGYVISSMKNAREAFVGDTLVHASRDLDSSLALPGFKPMKPMVFAGVFPFDTSEFEKLHEAMEKLTLNDASVSLSRTSSAALGQGFRLGFLGMLHMDVFKQRLEEEYDARIIITNPSVPYEVVDNQHKTQRIENPSDFPYGVSHVAGYREPFIKATIILPEPFLGSVIKLCESRRGKQKDMQFLGEDRILLLYDLPMTEVAENHFFNELKQISSGYASFDYEESHFEDADLVKLDVALNGEPVDALASITHRTSAETKAREIASKMKEVMDRQQFDVSIQVLCNNKPIARETLKALRKDVTAKCYGGDQTRKRKLLEKQKEGKKRMKSLGRVQISHEAFLELVKK